MKRIRLAGILLLVLVLGCQERTRLTPEPAQPSRAKNRSSKSVASADIFQAAEKNDLEGIQRFLAQGVDLNGQDLAGRTPLHIAAWKGHFRIVEALVDAGAEVNALDDHRETPLHHTTWDGNEDVARFLLSRGAAIDARDAANWTPLHWAAWKGQVMIIRELVLQGAAIVTTGRGGVQPLHSAAGEGHSVVTHLLLKNGALPNIKDGNGNTALHYAVFGTDSKEEALTELRILVGYGAYPLTSNDDGKTPLLLAEERGWERTAKYLRAVQDPLLNAARGETSSDCYYVVREECTNDGVYILAITSAPREASGCPYHLAVGGAHYERINRTKIREEYCGNGGILTQAFLVDSEAEARELYKSFSENCEEQPLVVKCLYLGGVSLD